MTWIWSQDSGCARLVSHSGCQHRAVRWVTPPLLPCLNSSRELLGEECLLAPSSKWRLGALLKQTQGGYS